MKNGAMFHVTMRGNRPRVHSSLVIIMERKEKECEMSAVCYIFFWLTTNMTRELQVYILVVVLVP